MTTSTGVAGGGKTLVDALRGLLLTIAAVDGLVCLYMLTQALALTAGERRSAIAVLRACGAGARSIRVLLAGAALAVLVPAARDRRRARAASSSARPSRGWRRDTPRSRSPPTRPRSRSSSSASP